MYFPKQTRYRNSDTEVVGGEIEWKGDDRRERANQASSSGANQEGGGSNLRHLQDGRQLGIGHDKDRHRRPASVQMTRNLGNNQFQGRRSEGRTMPEGGDRQNLQPKTRKSAWRDKFDGMGVGSGMYSGEEYADPHQVIGIPRGQSGYIEFLHGMENNDNLSAELKFFLDYCNCSGQGRKRS